MVLLLPYSSSFVYNVTEHPFPNDELQKDVLACALCFFMFVFGD